MVVCISIMNVMQQTDEGGRNRVDPVSHPKFRLFDISPEHVRIHLATIE